MKFLAYILATLTQHNRQKIVAGVDFEWSSKSWTHNAFRLFELVFWRREGIRAESSSGRVFIDGEWVIWSESYTLEATIGNIEGIIRTYFTLPKFHFVMAPQLVTAGGFGFPSVQSPFMFAIAPDAIASGTSTGGVSSITWNHTCTGSNLLIVVSNQGNLATATNNITGNTYNGTAFTQVGTGFNGDISSLRVNSFWWLLNPTTGTNAVITSSTASGFISGTSASYSGVNQSGQPDASNNGAYGATTVTFTITVVTANSWIIFGTSGRSAIAGGTGSTWRSGYDAGTNPSDGVWDSGGALTTGSHSCSIVYSGAPSGGNSTGASFAPALAVATTAGFLLRMI